MAEEVDFSDLVTAMLEKFGKEMSCEMEFGTSPNGNAEGNKDIVSPSAEDFDPASPYVLLLVCKWYGKADEVARTMVSLYPQDCSILLYV